MKLSNAQIESAQDQSLHSAPTVQRQRERQRKARKPSKPLKQRIENAISKSELLTKHRTREVILLSTGQLCYDFPWGASTPAPWPSSCSRILIPLATPTRRGHRALFLIVRNSKLKFGDSSKRSFANKDD